MPAPSRRRAIPARWRDVVPASTIRMRLTALYGGVFFVSSAALLTVGYLVVHRNLRERPPELRRALERVGLHPVNGTQFGFPAGSPEARLVHTVQEQVISGALHRLLIEYIVSLVVITALAMLVGWLLAGRALAPLRAITATARRVSGETLGERIALTGRPDELKELADTFDGMLERLDAAFASQRRFVANASHELRTPLAIMRTELDVALEDPGASAEELRAMGEAVLESIDRSERLIASLLTLARSQAVTVQAEPVDLAALAADCVTDLRARARDADVTVSSKLGPAWVDGDPGLLAQLIGNLVDNAVRHNTPGGWVTVATAVGGDRVTLTVANGGEPIAGADLAGLTEPFRRLRRERSGFGLGLSIVRSIAEAHGGSATLSAPESGGLVVAVTLLALRPEPAVEAPAGAAPTRSSSDPQLRLTES